jgi:thioredoxin reductase (NADPH)
MTPTPITTDALIIGAGPIGLFQAFQLGLLDIHAHIVDALPHPGGQCAELYRDKPIYDIPGLPVTTGWALAESLRAQIEPFVARGTVQLHFGELVNTVAQLDSGGFAVTTASGLGFIAKTLFIAAGAGAFVPRKLKVPGLEVFEGTQLFYQDQDEHLPNLEDRHVVIQGDDDVALNWALQCVETTKSVTLLHRREVFTAAAPLVSQMRALCAAGKMRFVAGQITAPVVGEDSPNRPTLTALQVALPDGSSATWPADVLLASLGLSPRLGPLADWGLALQRKQLPVDTEKFQTAQPGIFAVGDINTYPGKKKLIVCGFHECVLAAFAAAEIVHPNTPQPLQYTTTSTRLHGLLGVAGH